MVRIHQHELLALGDRRIRPVVPTLVPAGGRDDASWTVEEILAPPRSFEAVPLMSHPNKVLFRFASLVALDEFNHVVLPRCGIAVKFVAESAA